MESFKKQDFENLSGITDKICVSIYIPTHQSGIEVNEDIDRISFKNEIQKVKDTLKKRNLQDKYITEFLKQSYELLDDISFWKSQSRGLAVFIKENNFWYYRLPIPFENFNSVSPRFEITPLLPLLIKNDIFYTLALSHNKIKLFKNTSYTYYEEDISGLVPENADEIFSLYEFKKQLQGKNINSGGNQSSKGNILFHGHNPEDKSDKYIFEFMRKVNNGIIDVLKDTGAPLVIAAVDHIHALYKEANTYKNIVEEGIDGNPENLSEKNLHQRSYQIIKPILNKPRKKTIEKYTAWAGTGKTSYDLETILNASYDGRIESILILDKSHVWGEYNEKEREIKIHEPSETNDICLISLAVAKTIENNGEAFLIEPSEMPENHVTTSVIAIFRY